MPQACHVFSDEHYYRIKDLLPGKLSDSGVPTYNNRLFIDAVLFILKTSIPWRDLSTRFGNRNSIYQRFNRWAKNRRWADFFNELREIDLDEWQTDSTIIRAHQHAAGEKKRSR